MIGGKSVNTLTDAAFGEWLRRRRRERDWTQNELASRTACSPITIRKIEGGDLKPSRQLAEIFARVLEIPQDRVEAFVKFARSGAGDDFLKPTPPAQPSAAPAQDAPAPRASLPAQMNELIGRKHDIAALMTLLRQPAVRLVTLTGAPGTGKTRLSIAMGEAFLDEFADGVFFVPLANIVEPEQVVPAIAQTLGLREVSMGDARPMRRELHVFLRSRHALLILDNFEQVIEAAPEISEMLSAAPRVKVVVTSREVLRVYGEREFPTAPLPLPDVVNLPPLLLREVPSIRLFVERAQAVKLDFALTPDNAASVAQICAFLDGLPLAIEMAAAQIRRMPPARLLAQLQSRATSLSAGRRDLSPRQQTLRRAIEWSYDLLSADERAAFEALSVFAGGF
ncbi:MAG TPA: helix-turn-helix domain-containing protein, partial [Thermoflexales bacterium]|nr:helix-turn-helix domain-containing protein [Thermoflexales bacterium]